MRARRVYTGPEAREMAMGNPTAAMLVIGDEILSGRTRDSNMHHLAGELTRIGIALREVRVVADVQDDIVAAVRALAGRFDQVFTSGGIGPTHDDVTADAVALAMGAAIGHRADAMALLQAHYDRAGLPFNEARQRMARIPDGATLIDNPVSTAPGFTIGNVHVMAGVPNIFQAMVASVLSGLAGGPPLLSQSLRVDRGEGEVAAGFGALAAEFPDLSMGSYPFIQNGAHGTNLVIRGTDPGRLAEAMVRLNRLFG
jgi:molybdenum cofactor synthesis domain-containing protein